MATPDLVVAGGGVFGLAVAWAAVRRGARVVLVERDRIGAGASGGVVGALAPFAPVPWSPLKAFQLEALRLAPGWWGAVASAGGGDPGYARIGRRQVLADARAQAAAARAAAAAAGPWGDAGTLRIETAADGWPAVAGGGAVAADTLSARLHPRRALAALAAALAACGGEIREAAALPAGSAPVVWATGAAGLAEIGAGDAVKGQAARLDFDAGGRPMVTGAGLYIVPQADGSTAVGSTSETHWTDPAPDGRLDAVIERARRLCPALAGAAVVERWSGLRPRSASRGPLLGPWPGRPGHWIANGGFKIGFALAPLVGELVAAAVLDGADAIPPPFRPAAAPAAN
jgi:glycine/D-amino acid oxidase-like deaminating enzyme